ncbi:MAG: hypothetical protein IJQ66_07150 [Clostridia bacterium]|nr:hypothetical protein [Clostridia bacterium]
MSIKMGWAEVDITPEKGTKIGLAGQFFERITDEVESKITVTAFALESGADKMVICSCDLVSVDTNLHKLVKAKVEKIYPELKDKIITNAIHTHTSYVYKRVFLDSNTSLDVLKRMLPEGMEYKKLVSSEKMLNPETALNFLVDKISEAIVKAWETRADGYYANAFGRAAVGMCRRVCYDDGSAKMWGDTNLANFEELEAGNDSGIEIIYTFDKNKELNGVIANIACPSQVVEHRSFISSDYWGKVKENLRKYFGKNVFVLALCSAAGDQCPRDLVRWVNPETPIDDPNIKREDYIERKADPSMFDVSGLKVVGRRISNELISVYEELDKNLLKNDGVLKHETINMTLPLRRVTISEYNYAVEKIENYIEKNKGKTMTFDDNAKMHIYAGTIARYEFQQKVNTFDEEIHIIRFGDIAIATNPFELFLNYGNKIRARSRAKQTFLIQLCCGADGYLPTEKAEKGSHYSAYVSSGYAGHEGGDLLVRETLTYINDMFKD